MIARRAAAAVMVVAFAALGLWGARAYYAQYYASGARLGVMAPDEPERRLRRALAYDPGQPQANLLMAGILGRRGEVEEALRASQRAQRGAPSLLGKMQEAGLFERAGRADDARRTYEYVLAALPGHPPALARLAALAAARGDATGARAAADELERQDSLSPSVAFARARAAEIEGRRDEAIREYAKASAAGEPPEGAIYHLDDVRRRLAALVAEASAAATSTTTTRAAAR